MRCAFAGLLSRSLPPMIASALPRTEVRHRAVTSAEIQLLGGRVLFAVDVGNTQSVLGLFDDAKLVGHWRISTNASLTGDELRVKVAGLLSLSGFSWSDIGHVILASVVPRLTAAWEE